MMAWLTVSLDLEAGTAETFGDALLAAGAQSVALEAGRLSAILKPHEDAEALIAAAARASGIESPRFTTQQLEDQDWVRSSQAQFAPLRVGRLWIGPTWHQPPADARAIVRIDPGLAFGTGSHPTTKLVLGFLEKNLTAGERVLDYGCGSGILAIAAAKLGAADVDAVDVDPQAVETTAMNARLNQIALRALPPESLPAAAYDLVVSNILFQPLVVLAPLLGARTASGGRIALAGILDAQAEELVAAYSPWFDAAPGESEEGWTLVTGTRR
ncbi:MAG: ribosomal protein methyltransferase [Betaproteobacteria bacterium]|jgi:ribosomal protein L11 methyltransferase|nr:ribosomal protein methyltransferase [Betaproteobacteria bacterium]